MLNALKKILALFLDFTSVVIIVSCLIWFGESLVSDLGSYTMLLLMVGWLAIQAAQYMIRGRTIGEALLGLLVVSSVSKTVTATQICYRVAGQLLQLIFLPLIVLPLITKGSTFSELISDTRVESRNKHVATL